MPPLRDRCDDILTLADALLTGLASDLGRGPTRLGPEAQDALTGYSWPGNVRELRNVLERALLLSDGGTLTDRDMHFEATGAAGFDTPRAALTLRELEIQHIEIVLREEGGRVQKAAERLGIPKSSLYQKLKTYDVDPSRFRNVGSGIR